LLTPEFMKFAECSDDKSKGQEVEGSEVDVTSSNKCNLT